MRKWLLGLLLLMASLLPANAQVCASVPYTFTNGTTADAGQVNANFAAVLNCFNSNTASSGSNSNITALTGLTQPPSGTGSFVFQGTSVTATGAAITIGSTVPAGFTATAGNVILFVVPSAYTAGGTTTITIGGTAYNLDKVQNGGEQGLVTGDLAPMAYGVAVYDGTSFELESSHDTTPTNEIGYFARSSCPPGWLAANGSSSTIDMRGVFPRGQDNGRGQDPNGTVAIGTFESEAVQTLGISLSPSFTAGQSIAGAAAGSAQYPCCNGVTISSGDFSVTGTGNETRPKTTVLLACQKL